jgi:dTDP-4-amino-4,6-dideoxygalactose transaminase
VIHCGDLERLGRLRLMGNFGFGEPNVAILPGLNAKLSEVGALMALAKLAELEEIVRHRVRIAAAYRAALPELGLQQVRGSRVAHQFMPVLLPAEYASCRGRIMAGLRERGIECRHYFSPHLAEQPYFAEFGVVGELPVTHEIAARQLSLPMADDMTIDEVAEVSAALRAAMAEAA